MLEKMEQSQLQVQKCLVYENIMDNNRCLYEYSFSNTNISQDKVLNALKIYYKQQLNKQFNMTQIIFSLQGTHVKSSKKPTELKEKLDAVFYVLEQNSKKLFNRQKLNFQNLITQQGENPQGIYQYWQLQKYVLQFYLLFGVKYNLKKSQLTLSVKFIKNSIFLSVKPYDIRVLFLRKFNKINLKLRTGKFLINMQSGLIKYQFNLFLSKSFMRQKVKSVQIWKKYICYLKVYIMEEIDLAKILEGMNEFPEKISLILEQLGISQKKSKQSQLKKTDIINELTQIYNVSHEKYSSYSQSSNIRQQQSSTSSSTNNIQKLTKFILQSHHESHQKIQRQLVLQKYKKYLIRPVFRSLNPHEKLNILNQITFISNFDHNNWLKHNQDESSIYSSCISQFYYTYNQNNLPNIHTQSNKIRRNLLKKSYKQGYEHLITKELNILRKLELKSNCNIAKFYFVKNEKDILFQDYNGIRDIRTYIMNRQATISLFTKIHLISQIIQVLLFLHQNKIVYNNLKIDKIFIAKDVQIKLTEFQSSYQVEDPNTLQFKVDLDFLSTVINEMIFKQFPVQIQQKKTKNKQRWVVPEEFPQRGPKDIISLYKRYLLKSSDSNKSQRPELEWLLFSYRQSIYYLDKFF